MSKPNLEDFAAIVAIFIICVVSSVFVEYVASFVESYL